MAYVEQGHSVFPVNPNAQEVEGLKVYPSLTDVPDHMDRITIYLPPEVGIGVLGEIADHGATELFLNPGSESGPLLQKAEELGLEPILACAMLNIGQRPDRF